MFWNSSHDNITWKLNVFFYHEGEDWNLFFHAWLHSFGADKGCNVKQLPANVAFLVFYCLFPPVVYSLSGWVIQFYQDHNPTGFYVPPPLLLQSRVKVKCIVGNLAVLTSQVWGVIVKWAQQVNFGKLVLVNSEVKSYLGGKWWLFTRTGEHKDQGVGILRNRWGFQLNYILFFL